MIGWLLGEFWQYIAGLVGLVAVFFGAKHQGRKSAIKEMELSDAKRANEVRRRVDATRGVSDEDIRYRD